MRSPASTPPPNTCRVHEAVLLHELRLDEVVLGLVQLRAPEHEDQGHRAVDRVVPGQLDQLGHQGRHGHEDRRAGVEDVSRVVLQVAQAPPVAQQPGDDELVGGDDPARRGARDQQLVRLVLLGQGEGVAQDQHVQLREVVQVGDVKGSGFRVQGI